MLTPREAQVLELRVKLGLSWREIAARVSTTKSGANSSYRAAMRKMDRAANPDAHQRTPRPFAQTVEVKKPDRTAAFLNAALNPFQTVEAAARACGFPPSTARKLIRRMQAQYKPLDDAVREIKRDELLKLLEDRSYRCFARIDDIALASASSKDLAIAGGIMVDESLVLRGEPTQIISYEDRRGMQELRKALLAEIERRQQLSAIEVARRPEGSQKS